MTHAVIVGGGIGGMSAALSLLDAGIEVTVLEQARQLQPIGAGIQIGPNAARVLRHADQSVLIVGH